MVCQVALHPSEFGKFHHRLAITEGADAAMQVSVAMVADSNRWQHELPPRGGFILRLDNRDEP